MKRTKILLHNIEWWYRDDYHKEIDELPESEEEHIKQSIIDGFHSGELNYYDENENNHRGWWEIK